LELVTNCDQSDITLSGRENLESRNQRAFFGFMPSKGETILMHFTLQIWPRMNMDENQLSGEPICVMERTSFLRLPPIPIGRWKNL
jgi:hypothetical protein